eukprot:CAMPEP_0174351208 /NCGR_PEP_ID=MMETSP0811_2-20130205/8497_1 /TAXON_ID=73025 ORGANISM="Eutreptiella gymnastica-like, Strain CCMP1594" /NCGR_SAMPLE_ID=MMETSP0811_2 /ASSEMBLY_ACC=CAM_ASM_000667 /LENGTH=52 /DNA_ID=CAMNT_0015480209 /DNA_START=2168 /DNA_END=2322 /DNA_ORIENTATION=+
MWGRSWKVGDSTRTPSLVRGSREKKKAEQDLGLNRRTVVAIGQPNLDPPPQP